MLRPARLWIYRLATCGMPETRLFGLKADLLCWCGAQVGTNVRLNSSVHIHPYPRNFRDKGDPDSSPSKKRNVLL